MTVRQCRLKVVGLQYFCLCNDSETVQAPGCRSSVTSVYVMTVRQCRLKVLGLQYFCLCNDSEAVQAPGCRSSVLLFM